MTRKELLQLSRDLALLLFFLYAFTADIYLAANGVTLQLYNAQTAFRDGDRSEASRDLISRFRAPYFEVLGNIERPGDQIAALDRGQLMVVLEIPERFQESLLKGQPTELQMLVDATHAPLGYLATSYAAQIVGRFALDRLANQRGWTQQTFERLPLVENRYRVWYNANQEDSWFTAISELLAIITIFSILLPAAALVRERERGTVEQLLVSPLTPLQIMIPKVLAMTLVILVGTLASIYLVMQPAFGVPFRGSAWLFFSLTALYAFTNAGVGLLAATLARNQAQVGMISILLVAPMILLSGAWTPPEAMPTWLRQAMQLSPLYHYIQAAFGILLKGAGLAILWDSVLAMALLGSVLLGFGTWRFGRRLQ